MKTSLAFFRVLFFICGCLAATQVLAQMPAPAPAPVVSPAASGPAVTAAPVTSVAAMPVAETVKGKFRESLFLSTIDIALIEQALSGKMAENADVLTADDTPKLPIRREIEVSGILYRGAGDWIVWMNGKKMTPKNLLPEIVEIHVDNSSIISFKWYDAGRKSVIPVRMRPRQVYDIASGAIRPAKR